ESKTDRGNIILLAAAQERCESSRASDDERQHARRQRIERARMADARSVQRPPYARHDVVRRRSRGFVDDEDAVQYQLPASSFQLPASRDLRPTSDKGGKLTAGSLLRPAFQSMLDRIDEQFDDPRPHLVEWFGGGEARGVFVAAAAKLAGDLPYVDVVLRS